MAFSLPELPYPMDALEPYISKKTLEYHYGKHHQTYVNKINKLIEGTDFEDASLEDIIRKANGGIFNNGAQVWNHTFYWNCMKPASEGDNQPSPEFRSRLEKDFGSFEEFIESFSNAATSLFGSGWVWLVKKNDRLEIVQKDNAGNPIRDGETPLLTCDVWEHAYYLDKQNRRPAYVEDFWKVVDWDAVEKRL